jgi:RNA polymerase sigma factor (sigma-70 family)
VFDAVGRLPRRQRECLLLRVRAGMSHAEIAALLGIGVGSVKSHLVEARRTLVGRFGRELDA